MMKRVTNPAVIALVSQVNKRRLDQFPLGFLGPSNSRQTHNGQINFYKRQFLALGARSQSWKLNNFIKLRQGRTFQRKMHIYRLKSSEFGSSQHSRFNHQQTRTKLTGLKYSFSVLENRIPQFQLGLISRFARQFYLAHGVQEPIHQIL